MTAKSLSILTTTASSGSASTSAAALARSRAVYSTTEGQTCPGRSETPVAQPVKKIIATPRATRGGVQHLALNVMGLLR